MADVKVYTSTPDPGAGGPIDLTQVTTGAGVVDRQRISIADSQTATDAPVSTAAPAGTEAGLYVRVVSQPAGGASVDVTDRAGRILGHVIVDAGTAVIGHVIVDSASNVSITALPSIPAGSNVIGHVIVDSLSGSVTVTGTVAISGTVDVSDRAARLLGHTVTDTGSVTDVVDRVGRLVGHVNVDNFPATQPISGTVAVSNFPATQPVSGTVGVTQVTNPWVVNEHLVDQGLAGTQAWLVSVTNATTLPTNASTEVTLTTIADLLRLQNAILRSMSFQLSFLNMPRLRIEDLTPFMQDESLQ